MMQQPLDALGQWAVALADLLEALLPDLDGKTMETPGQRYGATGSSDLEQCGARRRGCRLVCVIGEPEQARHRGAVGAASQNARGTGARIPQPLLHQGDQHRSRFRAQAQKRLLGQVAQVPGFVAQAFDQKGQRLGVLALLEAAHVLALPGEAARVQRVDRTILAVLLVTHEGVSSTSGDRRTRSQRLSSNSPTPSPL